MYFNGDSKELLRMQKNCHRQLGGKIIDFPVPPLSDILLVFVQ
jgi:hypothetical protein